MFVTRNTNNGPAGTTPDHQRPYDDRCNDGRCEAKGKRSIRDMLKMSGKEHEDAVKSLAY